MHPHAVYYAHPMASYGGPTERDDLALLASRFATVVNPNTPTLRAQGRKAAAAGKPMAPFVRAVERSDAVAWRAFPDGTIGAGVWLEIQTALRLGKPVYRLPDMDPHPPHPRFALSIAQTVVANRRWGGGPPLRARKM